MSNNVNQNNLNTVVTIFEPVSTPENPVGSSQTFGLPGNEPPKIPRPSRDPEIRPVHNTNRRPKYRVLCKTATEEDGADDETNEQFIKDEFRRMMVMMMDMKCDESESSNASASRLHVSKLNSYTPEFLSDQYYTRNISERDASFTVGCGGGGGSCGDSCSGDIVGLGNAATRNLSNPPLTLTGNEVYGEWIDVPSVLKEGRGIGFARGSGKVFASVSVTNDNILGCSGVDFESIKTTDFAMDQLPDNINLHGSGIMDPQLHDTLFLRERRASGSSASSNDINQSKLNKGSSSCHLCVNSLTTKDALERFIKCDSTTGRITLSRYPRPLNFMRSELMAMATSGSATCVNATTSTLPSTTTHPVTPLKSGYPKLSDKDNSEARLSLDQVKRSLRETLNSLADDAWIFEGGTGAGNLFNVYGNKIDWTAATNANPATSAGDDNPSTN